MATLKRIGKIARENAFDEKKKKYPGLALISHLIQDLTLLKKYLTCALAEECPVLLHH